MASGRGKDRAMVSLFRIVISCLALLATLTALPVQSRQKQNPLQEQETLPSPQIAAKQKQDLLKSNFEKMKRDADELASLAKSLQEDLDKSNQNLLSLKIVNKAEKIEKLAKKIKEVAKGY
jgi:hypothetical protein